ncbi:MAG: metallophosphoesterase [Crocinitomicaceae bacterium]
MSFWIVLIIVILIILLLKLYILRGIRQLWSKQWRIVYFVISVGSLVIGIPTMILSFKDGMINLHFIQNFTIAFMISVFICELIVVPFFLVDDIRDLIMYVRDRKKENREHDQDRRRFIKTTGLVVAGIPFLGFMKGITFGKYAFHVRNKTLKFPDLPKEFDGFRILQFSDMHSGSFDSYDAVKGAFDMIQEQQADVILFTGDLVNDLADEVKPYVPLLKGLKAKHGKFSILGNHDYSRDRGLFPSEAAKVENFNSLKNYHKVSDFRLLMNENCTIEKNGESIRLIGVENWGHGFIQEGDFDKAIIGTKEDEFSILMSHDPTHWEDKVKDHDKHVHLTLSGHTHGTQMGVEIGNFKWSPGQYIYKRWADLYQERDQYLYINRGMGWIGFAGRVGIHPEITVITLRKS